FPGIVLAMLGPRPMQRRYAASGLAHSSFQLGQRFHCVLAQRPADQVFQRLLLADRPLNQRAKLRQVRQRLGDPHLRPSPELRTPEGSHAGVGILALATLVGFNGDQIRPGMIAAQLSGIGEIIEDRAAAAGLIAHHSGRTRLDTQIAILWRGGAHALLKQHAGLFWVSQSRQSREGRLRRLGFEPPPQLRHIAAPLLAPQSGLVIRHVRLWLIRRYESSLYSYYLGRAAIRPLDAELIDATPVPFFHTNAADLALLCNQLARSDLWNRA